MGTPMTAAPDWAALTDLYERLALVEGRRPGCDQARDLEDAVTLLLNGACARSLPEYRGRDAVRRARFLRQQADRKRPAAVARRRRPVVRLRASAAYDIAATPPAIEPVDHNTPESVICSRETVRELLAAAVRDPRGRHAAGVLVGLLADTPPADIAARLGVSRSTVDRCTAMLRGHLTALIEELVA